MIVLDASALVDVIADQPTKTWVLDQVRGQRVVAPAHQPAEVLSAVARLVRGGILTAQAGRAALAEADDLPQELVSPTVDHLRESLDLQDRVRVLDGLYVAVARDHDAPLVTTDRRLARTQLPVEVVAPNGAHD